MWQSFPLWLSWCWNHCFTQTAHDAVWCCSSEAVVSELSSVSQTSTLQPNVQVVWLVWPQVNVSLLCFSTLQGGVLRRGTPQAQTHGGKSCLSTAHDQCDCTLRLPTSQTSLSLIGQLHVGLFWGWSYRPWCLRSTPSTLALVHYARTLWMMYDIL